MSLLRWYDELLERLLAELKATYGPRLVAGAVYGSVGRGTPREDSDLDVLVVARKLPDGPIARMDEFRPILARLERALAPTRSEAPPVLISPVLKTPSEVEMGSPLFLDMVEDARLLYDPEGFLGGYLHRLRSRLQALGARRVWRGDTWYWDLKPDLKPGEVFQVF
jgi:predicted nucleotidyltransferase